MDSVLQHAGTADDTPFPAWSNMVKGRLRFNLPRFLTLDRVGNLLTMPTV